MKRKLSMFLLYLKRYLSLICSNPIPLISEIITIGTQTDISESLSDFLMPLINLSYKKRKTKTAMKDV